MTTVALVDDHILLRNSLATLVNSFDGFKVLFEADHGADFVEQITSEGIPDIILLDITMPVMNGFETLLWIKQNAPQIKVIMLTMMDNEMAITTAIKNGARAYLLKTVKPIDLLRALSEVAVNGYFFNEFVTNKLIVGIQNETPGEPALTEKQTEFLKLACTELTYKEIAQKMNLSPRTIENYRDELFEKLNVMSRVGLVLFAIKRGLYKL